MLTRYSQRLYLSPEFLRVLELGLPSKRNLSPSNPDRPRSVLTAQEFFIAIYSKPHKEASGKEIWTKINRFQQHI